LKEPSHVSVKVFNVAGQLVRTLVDEVREAGNYTDVRWNGRNERGVPVSSGLYFYKMVTKGYIQTKKMVLLK
jgi:flagellar hook assembly protein FlgD